MILNKLTAIKIKNYNRDLKSRFIKINVDDNNPTQLVQTQGMTMNILTEEQVIKKSHHFSRFDHSVVVIEYKNLKVTTSLEQALVILEKLK